jgi:hypothetical protein
MKRYLSLFFLAVLVALSPVGEVFARGGRGRGGGGRGGGGARGANSGGARGRGGMGGRGGANNRNNNERREQEEERRREERMSRVAQARLLYAQREREMMWNEENDDRFDSMLKRILGGATD